MKRLFYDIETAPNIGLFWSAGYKIDVSHDSIIKERAIITIAWKWQGEKKVHALAWDKNQNDKSMLIDFMKVAHSADELVAHYGDKFDMPWIRTRCLFHRLNALPWYKTIDTKAWASKNFYFNSNQLDYISKYLGGKGKIKTSYSLWKDILLNNCPKALKKMIAYNKRDVIELEGVWDKMQLVVPHHTHVGVLHGKPKWTCPRDGSRNVGISKTRVTASGMIQTQMQCRQCGGYYKIDNESLKKYRQDKGR